MPDPEDEQLIGRAQELSDVIPLVELFRDLADEVDDWWARGLPESEIDEQILQGVRELGWNTDMYFENAPELASLTQDQVAALVRALHLDEWTVGCVKAIARTGKPLPLIFAIGDVFVDSTTLGEGEKLVWAVATRMTNPEVVAKKFVCKCKETFGNQVTKDMKPRVQHPGQLTPTEALAANDRGMSYRDIAIQNLRRTYPEIIANPSSRRLEIRQEKERVVEEIRAARDLWSKRLPDSSIPD